MIYTHHSGSSGVTMEQVGSIMECRRYQQRIVIMAGWRWLRVRYLYYVN